MHRLTLTHQGSAVRYYEYDLEEDAESVFQGAEVPANTVLIWEVYQSPQKQVFGNHSAGYWKEIARREGIEDIA